MNELWTLLDPVYKIDKHFVKKPVDSCTPENIKHIEFTPEGVSFVQMNEIPMHNTQQQLMQKWTQWKVTFSPDQISKLWAKEYPAKSKSATILKIYLESIKAPQSSPIVEELLNNVDQLASAFITEIESEDLSCFSLAQFTKNYVEVEY